jgi:hypothetical protein
LAKTNTLVQPLCLITVNPSTGKNIVLWERINKPGQTGYRIYKETNVSGVYNLLSFIPSSASGFYLDTASNPKAKSDRYKISSLDTCGNESVKSDAHKTLHLNINAGINNTWNLIWEAYEGLNATTIYIYRGNSPSGLTLLTSVQGSINSYTDLAPPLGTLYYMVAVDFGITCDPSLVHKTTYSTSESNIVSNTETGISIISRLPNIRMYPNPASDYVIFEGIDELSQVTLIDASGRIVGENNSSGKIIKLDIGDLEEGVYMARVLSGENYRYFRIIRKVNDH